MKKKLKFWEREIEYELKINKRAKRIRLTVSGEGNLSVSVPEKCPEGLVERSIERNKDWVFRKIDHFTKYPITRLGTGTQLEYLKYKKIAKEKAEERARYFSYLYGFKFNKIFIKNQKSRWGSCSRKGNLNFSYKIMFLPQELLDYIVVHELCHLKEFNHSTRFWKLVEKAVPDHKVRRKAIKRMR